MKIYKIVGISAILSTFALISFAENLPLLPKASQIISGEFPNGIKYYLVDNNSSFGVADFALVQNIHTPEDELRATLMSTPHFKSPSPYEFLKSRGVAYPRTGFVDSRHSSTVYRFENVSVTDSYSVDSLLMMIFDFCELCPANQAIIISGDISPEEIKGKMSIFSMTVPARDEFVHNGSYEWIPMESLTFVERVNYNKSASTIRATWSVPRTPDDALKNISVYTAHLLYGEMAVILEQRLRDKFMDAGIPLADVSVEHLDSSGTEGDESFSVSICIGKDRLEEGSELFGRVLAGVDQYGVKAAELEYAREVYLSDLNNESKYGVVSDAEYVDRCISAYLNGTDLSTDADEYAYLSKKDLSSLRNLELFNNFASVLIDPEENLVLEYDTPFLSLDRASLRTSFASGWNAKPEKLSYSFKRAHSLDSLAKGFSNKAVKLKTETVDPLSGGKLWTFSNGLKVIFKKTPGTKDFHYSVMVRGGFPSISRISEGEGAFVSDIVRFYDIPHYNCYDFSRTMRKEGIVFNPEISISDMRVTGHSEASKYKNVLGALLSFATSARANVKAFDYYADSEPLRIDNAHNMSKGIEANIDKMMRPEYLYSQYKYSENLSEDLQSKVVPYLKSQFSRFGDGIMVFIGDVEELDMLEWFKKHGGYFRAERSFIARPQAQYTLKTGLETQVSKASDGESEGIFVMNSTIVPVTTERYLSFRIACDILQRELSKRLGDYGYSCKLEGSYETYPQERISILTACHPVPRSGLPKNISIHKQKEVLAAIEDVLGKAGSIKVTNKELNIYKSTLSKKMAYEMSSASSKIDVVLTRYSEGKDLLTRYSEVMKLVTPEKISETLTLLTSDSSVEFLVEK